MHVPADGRDGAGVFDQDGLTGPEEELALIDEDERLPWLESGDEPEERGVATSRIIMFSGILLVALIALIGAIWYFTNKAGPSSPKTVATDGNTILAPKEPYKTRPDNPGGLQVAGTGDTSFEVAEGHSIEGKVADSPAPEPTAEAKPGFSEAKPEPSGIGVQVGAYATREAAQRGWDTLNRRYEALNGQRYRVVEAVVDGGTVYRLQAVPGGAEAAESLCQSIRAAGGDCQVKR